MRFAALGLVLTLAACAAGGGATLRPADAATALIVGARPRMIADSASLMTLRHGDGRGMSFEEANRTPMQLAAQTPGGPLAQAMGLFGQEAPTLYAARPSAHIGAAYLCGPDGPALLGVFQAPDRNVFIVGLREEFRFDTRADGTLDPHPYSPDMVCARLKLRRR